MPPRIPGKLPRTPLGHISSNRIAIGGEIAVLLSVMRDAKRHFWRRVPDPYPPFAESLVMRRFTKLLLSVPLCVALAAASACAKDATTPHVGKKVNEFSLLDFRGKPCALSDYKDSKLIVVAFLGVECPLSKLYAPRLETLAKEYEPKGVAF
ncbi:MAG TPA: redoxin domain-containing protein, partial [Pirellulales bacterium]|nr:redoxin domain-containing protein [Pirellulales bacterium]